jgi:hypothetical protein
MKRAQQDQEKKRADDAWLMRAWAQWHQEQLDEALAGVDGAIVAELMVVLDQLELNSAAVLLDFMQRTEWSSVDYATRLTALHQINERIGRLRENAGLAPIDDPLPPKLNVFFTIKNQLFPPAKVGREGFHPSGR